MAIAEQGWRPFSSDKNKVRLYLRPDDQPPELPVPFGAVVRTQPFVPYVEFSITPTQTEELLTMEFELPLSVQEAFNWYETELPKKGWQSLEKRYSPPSRATLKYRHCSKDIVFRVVIRHYIERQATSALIFRQVVLHVECET